MRSGADQKPLASEDDYVLQLCCIIQLSININIVHPSHWAYNLVTFGYIYNYSLSRVIQVYNYQIILGYGTY